MHTVDQVNAAKNTAPRLHLRIIVALLSSVLCTAITAQGIDPGESRTEEEAPEEIVVTGERYEFQLRLQLMESEKRAYELFNKFNDERLFDISCSVQNRTGSNLSRQVCQPEFEIQAMRSHAQDFLDSMPSRREGLPQGSATPTYSSIPMAAEIDRHQAAFKQKMQEVAEQHPEFLEAIKSYAELRARSEAAANAAGSERP